MGVLTTCPACGMASDAIRCPRCNALKVVGCTGSCTFCREHCESDACDTAPAEPRSPEAQVSPAAGPDS